MKIFDCVFWGRNFLSSVLIVLSFQFLYLMFSSNIPVLVSLMLFVVCYIGLFLSDLLVYWWFLLNNGGGRK